MPTYDDSAFLYFLYTFCIVYAVPGTIYLLKKLFRNESHGKPRSKSEKTKTPDSSSNQSSISRFCSAGFIINLIFLTIAWIIIFSLYDKISANEIAQFDPYEILGIEVGSTEKEIKKSYHTLSLKYHPDRNHGNKEAEKMFMLIAKAYEALTDPISRENYEKFGNPDGKQALEISIGLPSFLLNKDSQTLLLVLYLVFLVIIIPATICIWYNKNKKYSPKKVLKGTYGYFYHNMKESMNLKSLVEFYIQAVEFHPRLLRNPTQKEFDEIKLIWTSCSKKFKVKGEKPPAIIKGMSLIYAHMSRRKLSDEYLQRDLNLMLETSPQLIEAILEISFYRGYFELALNTIEFSQYLRQGMWEDDSIFKQIPYIDSKQIKSTEFKQFCKEVAKAEKVEDVLVKYLPKSFVETLKDDEKQEIQRVSKLIPQIEVTITFPEDESNKDQDNDNEQEESTSRNFKSKKSKGEKVLTAYQGDIITMTVKVTRHELEGDDEKIDYVNTSDFPSWLKEKMWIIVGTSKNKLVGFTQITEESKIVEQNVPIRIPPDASNTFPLDIYVKSDSYLGLDHKISTKINVLPAKSRPDYQVHEEDKNLEKQTLFGMPGDDEASESSDDDDGNDRQVEDLNSDEDAKQEQTEEIEQTEQAEQKNKREQPAKHDDEKKTKNRKGGNKSRR